MKYFWRLQSQSAPAFTGLREPEQLLSGTIFTTLRFTSFTDGVEGPRLLGASMVTVCLIVLTVCFKFSDWAPPTLTTVCGCVSVTQHT